MLASLMARPHWRRAPTLCRPARRHFVASVDKTLCSVLFCYFCCCASAVMRYVFEQQTVKSSLDDCFRWIAVDQLIRVNPWIYILKYSVFVLPIMIQDLLLR